MFNKKIIIFMFLIFLSLSAVSANNLTDDVSDDLADDNVLVESEEGNFTELSDSINSVPQNGTLELSKDYKHDSGDSDGIEITKSITISGNGHMINGSDVSRIFKISDSNIVLKDIIFSNAFTGDSGSVLNLKNVNAEIINCTFINNQATNSGGAVYLSASSVNITNCSFVYNDGCGLFVEGGAIYAVSGSHVNAVESLFYGNNADAGGAIRCYNAILNVDNCEFVDNVANWYGGSIYSDSIMVINSSTFSGNKAKLKGGAVHSTYNGFVENCFLLVDNSVFNNNAAEWGGAISSSNTVYTYIYNSQLYSNNAVYGAVFSRLSSSAVRIINSSCYGNKAVNGTVVYAPSCGEIILDNSNFTDNEGDCGALIYTVQGRFEGTPHYFNITVNNCNISDNNVSESLIFDVWGDILLNDSSFVYKNNQYPCFAVYKIGPGNVNYENNYWGTENPDFDKLIFINDTVGYYSDDSSNILDDGDCSSSIIHVDENHTVISFRRDSGTQVPLFIDYNGDLRQEKFDGNYFFHVLVGNEGWVIGNAGVDSPYQCEKIEAIARIMIQNDEFSKEYLDLIYSLIYYGGDCFGHTVIKFPDGRYALVGYYNDNSCGIEIGVLNPGEYILSPNDFSLHKKGNVSDLNIDDYVLAGRYISANDVYGKSRTTIQTYDYKNEIVNGQWISHVDVYISNDDGHFVNVSSELFINDLFLNYRYILGENIPVIMDGMYVGSYILDTVQLNKTRLFVSPVVTAYGNTDYLYVTLLDEYDNPLSGKQIIIGLNNSNLTFTTDSNGQVKVPTANLNSGAYIVSITFKGDKVYGDSEELSFILVNKLETELTASSISCVYNVNKNLVAALKDNNGNAVAGVKVNILINGKNRVLTTDKNGKAKLSTKGLAPNVYSAVVLFNGNENYENSFKTVKVTVKKAKVKLTAKKKTFKRSVKTKKFKVTLKNNVGKAVKKVKLTLKIKGKTYTAKTNKKGVATFKIKKFYKKGNFKPKVKFAGNKYYKPLTKTVRIKIK